jgi:hypothetical protein
MIQIEQLACGFLGAGGRQSGAECGRIVLYLLRDCSMAI